MSMSPIWNYKKWWEGKRCRMAGCDTPFRKVVKVEFVGPPSGVYGSGGLLFEGDTAFTWIPCGKSFKPGRKHVEVEPEAKVSSNPNAQRLQAGIFNKHHG